MEIIINCSIILDCAKAGGFSDILLLQTVNMVKQFLFYMSCFHLVSINYI